MKRRMRILTSSCLLVFLAMPACDSFILPERTKPVELQGVSLDFIKKHPGVLDYQISLQLLNAQGVALGDRLSVIAKFDEEFNVVIPYKYKGNHQRYSLRCECSNTRVLSYKISTSSVKRNHTRGNEKLNNPNLIQRSGEIKLSQGYREYELNFGDELDGVSLKIFIMIK